MSAALIRQRILSYSGLSQPLTRRVTSSTVAGARATGLTNSVAIVISLNQ